MKKSKTLSLFNVSIILVLNVYFKNYILLFVSLLFLLIFNFKELVILICLFCLITLSNIYIIDPIPIGYVDYVGKSYVNVNKILYTTRVETNTHYLKGQIVKTNCKSNKLIDKTKNKNNIKFINYNEPTNLLENTTLTYSFNILNSKNDEAYNVYNTLLFNEYNNNDTDFYFGYGFCIYYFLKLLLKKNRYLSTVLLLLFIIFFGFDIKYLIFIIDIIFTFFNQTNKNKIAIKIIVISFINVNLFRNYSILITLIFNLISYTKYNNHYILSLLQSLFFGQIQIFTSFFYKYYLSIRLLCFGLAIICFTFTPLESINLLLLKYLSNLIKILTFSIRGKVNLIIVLFIFMISKLSKISNNYFKQVLLLLSLLLNLNNPLKHVSFIDVGQGDSILISDKLNTKNVLIDTGSSFNYYKLRKYLFNEGVYNIDYLIITHNDSDHNGNIDNLNKDFNVRNIINEPIDLCVNNIKLNNLYIGEFDNDNDSSLIYLLNISDIKFLFTGDISQNVERLLVNKFDLNNINVLKVSHHGSKTATSSYFLSKTTPNIGIISTNGMYNHPHEEVINNLNSYFVNIFQTNIDGNITFYFTDIINFIKTTTNRFVIMVT